MIVPDYQLSLAIGKEGQNARLAAKLTGWRIDIRPDTAPGGAAVAPQVSPGRAPGGCTGVSSAGKVPPAEGAMVDATVRSGRRPVSVPERTCIGCRTRAPRSVLMRIVAAPTGDGSFVAEARPATPAPGSWLLAAPVAGLPRPRAAPPGVRAGPADRGLAGHLRAQRGVGAVRRVGPARPAGRVTPAPPASTSSTTHHWSQPSAAAPFGTGSGLQR